MRAVMMATAMAAAILTGCANQGVSLPKEQVLDLRHSGLSHASLPVVASTWWMALNDPLLNRLMQQALADSPTLAKAKARIDALAAQVVASGAATQPHLGAGASFTRSEASEHNQMGASIGGVPISTYQFGVQGSWTFDFWGKHAAQTQALLGAQQAAELGAAQARLLLSQAVFTAYSQWQALLAAQANVQAQIANQQRINGILKSRANAGLLAQAQTYPGALTLEQMQAQLAKLDGQIAAVRHALAALTAQQPYALDKITPKPLDVKALPRLPLTEITLNLVGRRPDILAARALVESKQAAVDAAKAQFYPDIRFSAMLGQESISGAGTAFLPYRSFSLSKLLSAAARQWSFGPALSLPILDGGALRANLRGQEAVYNEEVAAYNDVVLNAFRDSATAISDYQAAANELAVRKQALQAASRVVAAQQKRAAAGLDTPLAALQANAQKLSIQAEQIQAAASLQTAYGQTMSALGGDTHAISQ